MSECLYWQVGDPLEQTDTRTPTIGKISTEDWSQGRSRQRARLITRAKAKLRSKAHHRDAGTYYLQKFFSLAVVFPFLSLVCIELIVFHVPIYTIIYVFFIGEQKMEYLWIYVCKKYHILQCQYLSKKLGKNGTCTSIDTGRTVRTRHTPAKHRLAYIGFWKWAAQRPSPNSIRSYVMDAGSQCVWFVFFCIRKMLLLVRLHIPIYSSAEYAWQIRNADH